jgi:ABC-2 type transport system ATP-binding protein
MKAIEVNNLAKTYGNIKAVDNVSLSVEKGEFFALMGPNGSGKSTLASILATVNMPTGGSAKVMDFDVVSEAEKVRRVINYVPEFEFSSPLLTGEENLIFYLQLLGMSRSKAKEASKFLLNKVGLSVASKKLVSTYSSGMRRRLELASALIGDVSVLILDEPTVGLDPSIRRTIIGWLLEQLEKEVTVFFTTHIGEDAEAASRVAFMMNGRIVAEGTREELKNKYVKESIIHLKVTAKMTKIVEMLREFSVNDKVLETEDGYRLYSDKPEKMIPQIVEVVNKTGSKVLEIDTVKSTLEDAFFRMAGAPLG